MPENFDMTTYYARKLVHSPNNTTTFLRGDNTFSDTLTDTLQLTANKTVNLLGSAILNLGRLNSYSLGLDGTSIQARDGGSTSTLSLNPLGGQVDIGTGGALIHGHVIIGGSTGDLRRLTLSTDAGEISIFSGATGGNRGIEIVTNDTAQTVFYANSSGQIYFNGTLVGNASTATAWASARNVYVDLTSSSTVALNAGSTALGIGVTGVLPIASGGTNANNANGALVNIFGALNAATGDVTASTIFIGSAEDGDTSTWKQYTADALSDYVLGQVTIPEVTDALVYKGKLDTTLVSDTTTAFSNVPTSNYKVGWTYQVVAEGTYAGEVCKVNDLVICIADGPSSGGSVTNAHWMVIHSYPGSIALTSVTGTTNLRAIESLAASGNGLLKKNSQGNWEWDTSTYLTSSDLGNLDLSGAISKSIFTAAYQIIYSSAADTPTVLNPNTAATKQFLSMTGTGSAGAAPVWSVVTATDIGLPNVENTALSTWTGSQNITTLGTISSGSIPWSLISSKPTLAIAGLSLSTDNGSIDAGALRTALGLSHALRFVGTTSVNITDGSTANPLISGYNFGDNGSGATAGDVIIDSSAHYEYVWSINNHWERLGGDDSYKIVQTAIIKPTAITNTWVAAIGQDSNGNVTLDYAALDTSGTWTGNAVTATAWAANQTVYVNLANADTTTTINGNSQNACALGVDGTLGTGNGGTGATSHTANQFVWATSATTLQASGNHYINANKISVNSNVEPTENFLVTGGVRFVSTNQQISDASVIIGNPSSYHLAFGNNGLQANNGTNASALIIQPDDGTIIVGDSSGSTLLATYYGIHTFADDNGFKYTGIQEFTTNQAYYLWFSSSTNTNSGIPGYGQNLTYNPYTKFLTIDGNGGINTTTGNTLTLESANTLIFKTADSITFNQVSNNSTVEMGRFNSSRNFIIGTLQSADSITSYLLYVDGDTQIKGDLVPEDTETYNLGSSSLLWNKVYIGTDDTYGSNTNPIYWSDGVPTPLTYTANRLYYSADTDSFAATGHYASTTSIAINSTTAPTDTLFVNGTVSINDVTSITDNTGSSDSSSGALIVTGGVGVGENLNVYGDVGIGAAADGTHDLYVYGSSMLYGNVGIGADAQTGNNACKLYVDGTTELDDDTTINGILAITDTTLATSSAGALTVAGGVSIEENLYVTDTSQFMDAVGIGAAPSNTYLLYVYGDTQIKGDLVPQANDSYALGTSSLCWSDLFLSNELNIGGAFVANKDGEVTITAATPKLTLDTSTANKNDWVLQNASGVFTLDNSSHTLTGNDYGFKIESRLYVNDSIPTSNQHNFYVNGTSYFNGDTTFNGHVYMTAGKNIYMQYNNVYYDVITNENTKNILISAATGTLALGYNKTPNTCIYYTSTDNATRTLFFEVNSNGAEAYTRLGVNGQNTTYTLYVNGTGYFTDTVYFASGTTYYINSDGDARVRYLGCGNLDASSSYALRIGGDAYISGTHYFGNGVTYSIDNTGDANLKALTVNGTFRIYNAKNTALIYGRGNSNNNDMGFFGFDRSNPGDGDTYSNTKWKAVYYSYDSATNAYIDKYEQYNLPTVTADRTDNMVYSILTTKDTVTTGQGGTGNTTYTANRLLYSESATKLSSTSSIYASTTAITINGTTAPANSGNFQVKGPSTMQTIYPEANESYDLGSTTVRWNHLYVGTASSYGSYGKAVYWNAGIPAETYPVQYTTWTIASGGTTVTLTKNDKYFADTYVIALVVTSGEANLNGPITWTSAANALTLTTSAATSGAVSGYVLTARADSI